ncbi:hypothetical protein VU08_08785 [Desulfobulbus sp. F5]|nr:hypothetical protein [Desulfobulbus sp. F5]
MDAITDVGHITGNDNAPQDKVAATKRKKGLKQLPQTLVFSFGSGDRI